MMRFPDKQPTPSEYAVIAIVVSAILFVRGLAGFYFLFFATSEKSEVATVLTRHAGLSLGIGVFIGFSYWLFRRFVD